MDNQDIDHRLEFLDDARKNDKLTLANLQKRLMDFEGLVNDLQARIKAQDLEIARLSSLQIQLDQINEKISQNNVDSTKGIETLERKQSEQSKDAAKQKKIQEGMEKGIAEIKNDIQDLPQVKNSLKNQAEDSIATNKRLEELRVKMNESLRLDEDYRRTQHLASETQRQEAKRLTDAQGELSVLRKRLEETRSKLDVYNETQKKTDKRIGEIQSAESERRQLQNAVLEKQAMLQLERDKVWKEWDGQFAQMKKSAETFDRQLQSLENVQKSLRHAQVTFDEINQRMERRINEITEIQRLTEERFRQEWTTFKSEENKRWSNFTLNNEEQAKDINDHLKNLADRAQGLDDATAEINEMLEFVKSQSELHMQTLVGNMSEWLEDSRATGSKKRKTRKS